MLGKWGLQKYVKEKVVGNRKNQRDETVFQPGFAKAAKAAKVEVAGEVVKASNLDLKAEEFEGVEVVVKVSKVAHFGRFGRFVVVLGTVEVLVA